MAFRLHRAGHVSPHLFQPWWEEYLFLPFSPAEKAPEPAPSLEASSGRLRVLYTSGPICPFQDLAHEKSIRLVCHSSHLPGACLVCFYRAISVLPKSDISLSYTPPFTAWKRHWSLTQTLVICHQHQRGVPNLLYTRPMQVSFQWRCVPNNT